MVAEGYVLVLDGEAALRVPGEDEARIQPGPQKPGYPSHYYHTLYVAKFRLVLAVVVHSDRETSGAHSRSMLAEYLVLVSSVRKPYLVSGDVSFGSESVIGDCEGADVRYLFKSRRSKGVRDEFRALLVALGAGTARPWGGSARRGKSGSTPGSDPST